MSVLWKVLIFRSLLLKKKKNKKKKTSTILSFVLAVSKKHDFGKQL